MKKSKIVYVAMSGGVDSSVAAAILKRRGFNVVGVFFKPWSPTSDVGYWMSDVRHCGWRQDRLDAMRVAAILGIPFKTWDFSKEYGQRVVGYMIDSYRRGLTPNPDVVCNKEIKFGLFLKKALAEGADCIATGHYVKSEKRKAKSEKDNPYKLLQARDRNKDQSYFLWTLNQEQLKHCLFPIGGYTKPEVRALAKKFGLPNWNKKDSQGVCFVGKLNMKDFLKNYIEPRQGEIKLITTGETIGTHDGSCYYTIGQRHGLNITNGGGPYYVVEKDVIENQLTVNRKQMAASSAEVGKINWTSGKPKLPLEAQVKIRYRTEVVSARISHNGSDRRLLVKFLRPARAITPGQSAVFYRGREVLGGGVIKTLSMDH